MSVQRPTASLCHPPPQPPPPSLQPVGQKLLKTFWRGLHAKIAQSALIVIFKLVIDDLTNIILELF